MAHYVTSQLECIANGVEWGFPQSYIEGNGGSVVGVKTKLHERIKRFHTDFGKGYKKAGIEGTPGNGTMIGIVSAAGLINFSDKRLYEYPVEIVKDGYGKPFVMEEFQKTYVPYTHFYRNTDKTVDDNILDHVTHQYQIRPLYNQYQSEIVFNYKFTTPSCKKFKIDFHLASFYANEYEIYYKVLNGFANRFSTNSLSNNCPTREVIRQSLDAGGQVPSGTKYGIISFVYGSTKPQTSWELEIRCHYIAGAQTDAIYFQNINFTLLE
ncbi:hypothetical protein CYY_010049 [Polysphondylium violaceum]|uniref:Uncharacterized protein n=1 Tax=Polysphondylium violaceum TaxID=133409 RepID=A0A8J4PKN8_9MYCE|nr:hypothetical protein CYY_010049 [Polysphondylium violaceum]